MNFLKTLYKMPVILKILIGLFTFPFGTILLLIANTVAREVTDISNMDEKIKAVWSNPCDETVVELIKQVEFRRAFTISVGVTSVTTDIPQKLGKVMQFVGKNENISDNLKKELNTAIANRLSLGGLQYSNNYNHGNSMNDQIRQMEELNEQMRLADEMNRQHEFMFQEQMREFQQQQFEQQQQQFTDHMLNM